MEQIIDVLDNVTIDGHCQRNEKCIVCGEKFEYLRPSIQLTFGIPEYRTPIRIDICEVCIEDWHNEIKNWKKEKK